MRAVALRMQKTPYVLRGGTALALLYGLDRHSVDLDFDGGGATRVSVESCVEDGLQDAAVSMSAYIPVRSTWKGQRLKVHYVDPDNGEDRLLRVDLSFRKEPRPDDVVTVDGIRTYKIPALIDQKMNAADDRTKARDLYDLGFLAESYGGEFSTEQILRADEFSRDYVGLASKFRQAFEDDRLLRDVVTADDRSLVLRIAVVEQMQLRGLWVVEQAVPGSRPLADMLASHKIWLESGGDQGCRGDFRGMRFTGTPLCGKNLEEADLRRAVFARTDVRNANFRNADLREAVFDGCNMSGADFSGANLAGFSVDKSTIGPVSREFANALAQIAERKSPPAFLLPHRTELERDFGPSR